MTFGLTPQTFDGTNIQDSPTTYRSSFLAEHDILSAPEVEPFELEIPGSYPESPGSQPQSRVIPLLVELMAETQTALNNFKKLFDSNKGDRILVARDGDAVDWRLTGRVMGTPNFSQAARAWIVRLYVARPIWEQNTLQWDSQTATTSPKTWQVINAGTVRTYPVIQLKPTVAKANTADYLRRWPVSIASRTEQEMLSTDGLPYPIDVADDSLDTATEAAAVPSRLQADGDDLRVLIDGNEVRRDLDGVATATCKVWVSAGWKPKFSFTLAAAMTAVSPANGESFAVAEENGLALEPESGFVIIDTETIYYGARTAQQYQEILRGSRGTTAASHAVGATGYWREHDIYILSDYTAATEPNGSDVDRKPIIDLALSTNLKHVYAGPLTAIGTYRSGQFLRRYTNDNLLSPAISFLDGATPAFRDIPPSAAAAQFNNLELYVPCGIKAAAGAIEHDVATPLQLFLRIFGNDMEGLEALLATYDDLNDGTAITITPGNVLSRIRYNPVNLVSGGAWISITQGWALGASDFERATTFKLSEAADFWGIIVSLQKTADADGTVLFFVKEDANGPGAVMFGGATSNMAIAAADIGIGPTTLVRLLPYPCRVQAGTWYLSAYIQDGTTGTIYWNFAAPSWASGRVWYEGLGTWAKSSLGKDFACLILSGGAPADDALGTSGSGAQATVKNIKLTFDDATPRTPLIVRGTQETIYPFTEDMLSNDDTSQSIMLQRPILALNDTLEIDPYNKTIRLISGSASNPTIDVPWACVFSDEIDWFTLRSGVNNLRYVAGQGIGTVLMTLLWRGAWA